MKILIVEDEASVCKYLGQALQEVGYEVESAADGLSGRDLALTKSFDLILLDVMLPGMDGIAVCQELRRREVSTPIIFLSAKGAMDDKIAGLDAGADDYLPKPFQVGELLARVRANVRRTQSVGTSLRVGDIELDPIRRDVLVQGKALVLSPTEFALLHQLMLNEGRTVSRVSLLQQVWKNELYDDKVIDVYVSGLRKKLGALGHLVVTDRGVGYRMCRS